MVSEKIFEHTHTRILYTTDRQTYIHTYIHTLTREPSAFNKLYMYFYTPEHTWELFQVENTGEGGGLWRQNSIFLFGRGGEAELLFFNPVGGWLLWKCIIFCRWWSSSKMQFCGYPLYKWEVLEWKQKDEQTKSRFSREVKSRRIHCIIPR